jgi:hypothetical protein
MSYARMLYTAITVLALSLAVAAPAFGQSSQEGYNPVGPTTLDQVDEGGNGGGAGGAGNTGTGTGATNSTDPGTTVSQTGEPDGGNLPFTGLDVALLVGGGALLLLMGLGMRRLTRAPETA